MADHYYAWVRVGNGDPEPAAIKGVKPDRTATTIGCPDTFSIDDPKSGCSIIMMGSHWEKDNIYSSRNCQAWEMDIKFDPADFHTEVTAIEADEREKAYQAAIKLKPHSYAGFGRT